MPPIPASVREENRSLARGESSAALHRRLTAVDPEDARLIRPSDRARILRALNVFVATGRSLAAWQAQPAAPVVDPNTVERLILDLDRASLHRRIKERAQTMIAGGALTEVAARCAEVRRLCAAPIVVASDTGDERSIAAVFERPRTPNLEEA